MAESSYDCIVIGSGPGGYVAAIRAAQLGLRTAVIERDKVGGRCLNYACIPAKAVLRSADMLSEIREAKDFGLTVGSVEVDYPAIQARREKVVHTLTSGVSGLFKKNSIDLIEGDASITADGGVRVGDDSYGAGSIILATGSVPRAIPGVELGGRIIGTEEAWALQELPARLAVAGAGASGAEIASALRPPGQRGRPARDARPGAPQRGRRHLEACRAGTEEAGHLGPHGHPRRRTSPRRTAA